MDVSSGFAKRLTLRTAVDKKRLRSLHSHRDVFVVVFLLLFKDFNYVFIDEINTLGVF